MVMSIRWRLPKSFPLANSFLGGMDLKLGVSIISLFAVLNKVAGVYGILAVFTGGAEGIQLSMYLYSIATLVAVVWGLKKISEEDGPQTLLYAHFFAFDHLIGTVWTSVFAVIWWYYVPHDGRRIANSDAQKEMMGVADGADGVPGKILDEAARTKAAEAVWTSERGFSAGVLVLGWLIKIYFIFCVYSFAIHLRRGTYNSLPYSRPAHSHTRHSSTGGPRYQHLRNTSLATDDATLAETLWEDDESLADHAIDDGKSPVAARGTGMTRSLSGSIQQRESVSAQGGQAPDSPFARILSRLSGEMTR